MTEFTYKRQGRKVKQTVEEFITKESHNGRRGSPRIPSGTRLYAIRYENGGYFPYSYFSRKEAEKVIEAGRIEHIDTEFYRQWNIVWNKDETRHVGKPIVESM